VYVIRKEVNGVVIGGGYHVYQQNEGISWDTRETDEKKNNSWNSPSVTERRLQVSKARDG